MRFLCLYRPGTPEISKEPSPELVAKLAELLHDMSMAGALLAVEGVLESLHGVRLRRDQGELTAVEGPFPDVKQLVSTVIFIRTKTKADAVEWGKKLLAVLGEGELELR